MKLSLALLLIVSSCFCFSQGKRKQPSDFMVNHALNGLVLRAEANKSSEKIKVIEYGERLKLISIEKDQITLGGLSGKWVKVVHKKDTGYVFNAYLSKYPIGQSRDNYPYLKDYFYANFRLTEGDKDFTVNEEDVNLEKHALFGTIVYDFHGEECNYTEQAYFSYTSLQELIIVFCAYIPTYHKIDLNLNNFKNESWDGIASQRFSDKDENGFGLDYELMLKRDKNNEPSMYSVFFTWEAGGGHLSFHKWGPNGVKITHSYSCH